MTVYIVTGLGYGDEGKGTTVDYLARQAPSLVVRHNGGPQAGHNVVTPDGRHHCFSQFGSGTFTGASTFLSKFMLINPLTQMNEAEHLIDLTSDVWERMFVDENCLLITPWHVAVNRLEESARGDRRHGSCGQGIGVTVKQSIHAHPLSVRVKDIADMSLWTRLEACRKYLEETYQHLTNDTAEWKTILDQDLGHYLVYRYRKWLDGVTVVPSSHLKVLMQEHEHTIFEGAQGVLLDEKFGWHPYTTWSNCTHGNAFDLLRQDANYQPYQGVTRIGVLRAVTTRHGAGPHPTEDKHLTEQWNEPHNTNGAWQGAFRVGHLDLVAHSYAVRVCGGVDQLAVTHLDRSTRFGDEGWLYCPTYAEIHNIPHPVRGDLRRQELITDAMYHYNPGFMSATTEELLSAIATNLDAPVTIASHGPTCNDKVATSELAQRRM